MRSKHVHFEYCISLLFLTLRRKSEPFTVAQGKSAARASLPYCLITLLLGWWGVPWGILLTPLILWRNLTGGYPVADAEQICPPKPS